MDYQIPEEVIGAVRNLLEREDYRHVVQATSQLIPRYPGEVRLRRLQACGFGGLNQHDEAAKNFLNAFMMGENDLDLANFIGAELAAGQLDLGVSFIKQFYNRLSDEAKESVAANALTATQRRGLSPQRLPSALKELWE